MNIPNLIVSAEPLGGTSTISDKLGRQIGTEFGDETRMKVFLSQLHGLGLDSLTCSPNARIIDVLRSMKGTKDFQVFPMVLDLSRSSRDIQNSGMAGFAKKRISSAGVFSIPNLTVASLRRLPSVLKMDYGLLSILLAELEVLEFRRLDERVIFLHPSMADMALANQNKDFFRSFATFFRGRHGAEPGIMTNNIGCMLEKLDQWRISVDYVAGPVNRRGYHMRPNKHRCEELIRQTDRVIIATEISSEIPPTEEDFEYLNMLNVSSAIVELGNALDGLTALNTVGGTKYG